MSQLNQEQLRFWEENGFILLPGFLSPAEVSQLEQWTTALENLPETPGKWMKYFEYPTVDKSKRLLCRVENFVPFHKDYARFLSNETMIGILSQLMKEKAILFKEKINFKLPGGKGFKPHQDAPAFTTFKQTYHITMMVSIDPSTRENGCLEVVKGGYHKKGILAQEADGTIRKDVIDSLKWEPIPMNPGDVLFFDSYIPHGSEPNKSSAPRRALYITYNRESEGNYRDQYFAHKRVNFPPECERLPGVDYSKGGGVYNLGNPID